MGGEGIRGGDVRAIGGQERLPLEEASPSPLEAVVCVSLSLTLSLSLFLPSQGPWVVREAAGLGQGERAPLVLKIEKTWGLDGWRGRHGIEILSWWVGGGLLSFPPACGGFLAICAVQVGWKQAL